jgi:hypothetical protein
MAGQDLGQHLRHQQAARSFDPFGADDDRRLAAEMSGHFADGLGRADQQDRVARRESGELVRRLDAIVKQEARQIDLVGPIVRDRLGDGGIARPQGDAPAGASAETGKGRAPGTAADDTDVRQLAHRLRLKAIEMRSAPPR